MSGTGDLISRVYANFRGVDFRGEEINLVRSPDSLNMWKDYRKTESIRTRPSMKLFESFDDTIYGIFFYKIGGNDMTIVHSGTKLYKIVNGKRELLYSGANRANSNAFVYFGMWYFLDGKNYLKYDGATIGEVEGYVPITTIDREPLGGGEEFQKVNFLSDRRKNMFKGDGKNTEYHLDTTNIDTDFLPIVTIENSQPIDYAVNYEKGIITFRLPPPNPINADGASNITIEFKKHIDGYSDRIKKCTLLQVFDNRVFFSGNKDFPNVVYHCSLDDPSYFADDDAYNEGLDSANITGLVAGNNALWVFREPSQSNTSVFYHIPVIDDIHGKIYPYNHSSVSTGCVGKAISFNDGAVLFSDRGMENITMDVNSGQHLSHKSILVDSKLLAEKNYKNMLLAEWEGYLVVFIDDKAYLADSRGVFANEDHYEYEWFYWQLDKKITSTKVKDGVLYLGTENGLYTLTGDDDVESWWTTPKDKFSAPQKLKTTNKRGCVVETSENIPEISVYAKIEDTDFELIGTYENVTDYFVSRIKRKKWKDIQLKFYSPKRFSIETATLEAFVGGYIKR